MSKLIASIVVYRSALKALEQTFACLQRAGEGALAQGKIQALKVVVVDNASGSEYRRGLQALTCSFQQSLAIELIFRPDNGGYGLGHNAVETQAGDFRLVLNPDAFLEPDSLTHALGFLKAHPEVGVVVPKVLDAQGHFCACKSYPSVLALGLRGFAPHWLKVKFSRYLAAYEQRGRDFSQVVFDPGLISGCCFLVRGEVWQAVGGFDPRYFLYFEDFDFSLRARQVTRIAYLPYFRVVHLGGGAADKGLWHSLLFVRSAVRFFDRHGWRWI
jgi:GT2 family glycosyltransferase